MQACRCYLSWRERSPGYRKGKMVNAMNIAAQFQLMMPTQRAPECTEGYEGFYHLKSAEMGVARSQIRLHHPWFWAWRCRNVRYSCNRSGWAERRRLEKGRVELVLTDSYNMKEWLNRINFYYRVNKQAMIECDVEPIIKPIQWHRWCSLIFHGAVSKHLYWWLQLPRYSWVHYHSGMEQAVKVIVELSQRTAIHYQK